MLTKYQKLPEWFPKWTDAVKPHQFVDPPSISTIKWCFLCGNSNEHHLHAVTVIQKS